MARSSHFQRLFGEALHYWFPDTEILENYHPEWLHGMELDFYLPQYRVGIEVQGRQHYLFVPEMQATVDDFQAQRGRDKLKRELASQQGVKVYVVKSFKGVYKKLRNAFPDRKFRLLPIETRQAWKAHRRTIHEKNQNKWVAMIVKKSGELIGVNRGSADFLKINKEGFFQSQRGEKQKTKRR